MLWVVAVGERIESVRSEVALAESNAHDGINAAKAGTRACTCRLPATCLRLHLVVFLASNLAYRSGCQQGQYHHLAAVSISLPESTITI